MRKLNLVMMCVLLISNFTGCTDQFEYTQNTEIVESEDSKEIDTDNFVFLDTIKEPVFGEVFFSFLNGDRWHDVTYISGEEYVLDIVSAFPGFGYSVIIKGDSFSEDDIVEIKTDYGNYVYTFVEVKQYQITDRDKSELDKDIFNLGRELEQLYLYSKSDNKVFIYKLTEGTVVKVR